MPYRPMDRSWSTSPPGTRLTSSWAGSRPIPTSRRPSPRLDRVLQAGHGVVGRTTRTVVAMTTMTATAIEVEMPEPWLPAPPEPPPVRVDAEAVSSRPRLVTRPLALVLVASFGAMTSFYLLLSVVPLYASSAGAGGVGAGAGPRGAGLSPGGAQGPPPRLVARWGYRRVFAGGLVLLGAPAVALTASASMVRSWASAPYAAWGSEWPW